jgi:peptide/nickel transport system substrate-binding protein
LVQRFFVLALLGALITGCTQTGGHAGPPQSSSSGTLRIAIQQDLKNLNPLLNSNTTDVLIMFLMFEPLLHANVQGMPVPALAAQVPTPENGGISKDGLTITYHLRHGVKWTDGVPVTSKDVLWSWRAIMNKNNNVISQHGYDYVKSIETPDDYTVLVHLKRRFAPFVNTFFMDSDQPYAVAPAHVLAKYPNINQIPFNNDPNVSDGPFKFVRWMHGDHMEFVANDDYYRGKPGLQKIYVRVVPDENTEVNLLRTHQIDWMFEASTNNYPIVKDLPRTKIHWVDVNGWEGMWLNVRRPLLSDVRVRQAIGYAIDKQRIVDTSTFGQERVATFDQPPFMWSYDPSILSDPTDVQKARHLLRQAGFTPGPDGIMMKSGQRLSLVLVSNNSNVTRRKNSVLLQAQLRAAGIDVSVKTFPGDVLFAPAGEGGILQGGKFDLAVAGWYAGVDPDDSTLFTCVNAAPHGYGYSRYCSAEMDAAQNMALQNYDLPTRKRAYARIQELLGRDVPAIIFYYERMMHPISENFKGFAPNPSTESWNAWQWSI